VLDRILLIEELRRQRHRDARVRSEVKLLLEVSHRDVLVEGLAVGRLVHLSAGRQPVLQLEAPLDHIAPLLETKLLSSLQGHAAEGVEIPLAERDHEVQTQLQQSSKFNGRAVPWGRRDSLVPRLLRGAHLVHPGEAVVLVAAHDEARVRVHLQLDVEPLHVHGLVDVPSRVSLLKEHASGMLLENVLDDLGEEHLFGHALLLFREVDLHVVVQEIQVDLALQNFGVQSELDVVLDRLDEPPASVSAVVPRILALV